MGLVWARFVFDCNIEKSLNFIGFYHLVKNDAFEEEKKKETPKKRGRPKGTKAVIKNEATIEYKTDQIRGSDENNATVEKAQNSMDAPIPRKVKPTVISNVGVSEKSLMDQPIPKKVRGRPHKRIHSP